LPAAGLLDLGHLVDPFDLPAHLRGPHQRQLVHPVQQPGGDGLLVLEAELASGSQRSLDVPAGFIVPRRLRHGALFHGSFVQVQRSDTS
jgi:hypothetical protein